MESPSVCHFYKNLRWIDLDVRWLLREKSRDDQKNAAIFTNGVVKPDRKPVASQKIGWSATARS